MESQPILITTRDSSHATQRHSNVLERTFLTAVDRDNRPRIHKMTKRYPRDLFFVRRDKLCTRVSPDRGNYFLRPPVLSLERRCLMIWGWRASTASCLLYYFATYFHFRIDRFEMFNWRNPISIRNVCTSSLFVKLRSVRIEVSYNQGTLYNVYIISHRRETINVEFNTSSRRKLQRCIKLNQHFCYLFIEKISDFFL